MTPSRIAAILCSLFLVSCATGTGVSEATSPAEKRQARAALVKDPGDDLNLQHNSIPPARLPGDHNLKGDASWYGEKFHGQTSASGWEYDMYRFTAAHKSLPFHTIVRVTEKSTNKSVVVRITDRGPYVEGRIIDLSYAAAYDLGLINKGVTNVELDVLRWGSGHRDFGPGANK